jgi:hypothetical protein
VRNEIVPLRRQRQSARDRAAFTAHTTAGALWKLGADAKCCNMELLVGTGGIAEATDVGTKRWQTLILT